MKRMAAAVLSLVLLYAYGTAFADIRVSVAATDPPAEATLGRADEHGHSRLDRRARTRRRKRDRDPDRPLRAARRAGIVAGARIHRVRPARSHVRRTRRALEPRRGRRRGSVRARRGPGRQRVVDSQPFYALVEGGQSRLHRRLDERYERGEFPL